jgi:hypothetical protein
MTEPLEPPPTDTEWLKTESIRGARPADGPDRASLWLAYFRKGLISVLPIIMAGAVILAQAVDQGVNITGLTYWQAACAVAQTAVTFYPRNPVAKAVGGLVAVLAGVVAAALTSGGISTTELAQITIAAGTWLAATTIPNGDHPDVVQARGPRPGGYGSG